MKIGSRFYSLKDLNKAIEKYQKEKFIALNIRDSKKISLVKGDDSNREKGKKRVPNKDLIYQKIVYHCSKGGKKFKTTSTGARPHQR